MCACAEFFVCHFLSSIDMYNMAVDMYDMAVDMYNMAVDMYDMAGGQGNVQ